MDIYKQFFVMLFLSLPFLKHTFASVYKQSQSFINIWLLYKTAIFLLYIKFLIGEMHQNRIQVQDRQLRRSELHRPKGFPT